VPFVDVMVPYITCIADFAGHLRLFPPSPITTMSMSLFTHSKFKALQRDISRFLVNEAHSLGEPEKDYIQI